MAVLCARQPARCDEAFVVGLKVREYLKNEGMKGVDGAVLRQPYLTGSVVGHDVEMCVGCWFAASKMRRYSSLGYA